MDGREIKAKSIATVRTKATRREVRERSNISIIVFDKSLAKALEGIDAFSHLFVIFWMHEIRVEERTALKVHPRGREDMPLVGAFATRTPFRPNPIGLTIVELLKAEGNLLTVRGLDAIDGSPVLDIKPFDPRDVAEGVRVPKWWAKLEEQRKTD